MVEYELRESLGFELADRAGNPCTHTVRQCDSDLHQQSDAGLGSQQEESYLREDMWRRLSSQILRRLSTQLR